jgi:RND family efflux transporter MFP subunit
MFRKYGLPSMAVAGALLALLVVFLSQRKTPSPPILFPPPTSPYQYSIAAAGLIEASSENIALGSPFNEVIDKIFVRQGDRVKKGDPIFQLDLRAFNAAADMAAAQVEAAQVSLENARVQFSFYERLQDKRAVSEEAYEQAYYAVLEAEANVGVAKANFEVALANIERSTIRAPIDGQILQINAHVGEIAPIVPPIAPQVTWLTEANGLLVLMGAVEPLQVRIDIDEDDAWRYKKGAPATAFVRGNSTINFPMRFKRVEPYVLPKSSFTGEVIERIDTRVLQVIYEFDKEDLPIYTGLLVDVFIESEPIENFIRHEPPQQEK